LPSRPQRSISAIPDRLPAGVMGAVAGCPIQAVFDGDASLRKRPMRRILDPLEKIGARTAEAAEGGRLPGMTLQGGARSAAPLNMKLRCRRRRLKSAVLLAGLAARRARPPSIEKGSDPRPHRKDAQSTSAPMFV